MRQAGCAQTNPAHPDLLAALAEGVTPQTLADTAREGVDAGKGNPFTWAIATARGRHAQGPKPVAAGPPNGQGPPKSKTLSAIERLQASKIPEGNPDDPDLDAQRDSRWLEQAALPPARQLPR